jgi:hypothetical protein
VDDHSLGTYVLLCFPERIWVTPTEQELCFVVREEQQVGAGGEGSQDLARVTPFEQQPPEIDVEGDGYAALVGREEEVLDQVVAALREGRRDACEVQDPAG